MRQVYAGSVYLRHVEDRRSEAVDALAGLRATITQLRQSAEQQRDAAEAARGAAAAEYDQLASLRADAARERAQRVADESREQALVAQIRLRKDEYTA